MTTEPNELSVTEEAAAEMLGIRLSEVKRLRRKVLLPELDYVSDGRSVRIHPGGLKKIGAAVEPLDKATVSALVVEIPDNPLMRDLIVDALCPNPRIIMCHWKKEDGQPVRVRLRVKESKFFVRGMAVPACRMVQETLYAYEGRLPRLRGRWM